MYDHKPLSLPPLLPCASLTLGYRMVKSYRPYRPPALALLGLCSFFRLLSLDLMEVDPFSHFKMFSLAQHTMHATAPKTHLPESRTPGEVRFKNSSSTDKRYIYGIEVETCLKRHVGEDEE